MGSILKTIGVGAVCAMLFAGASVATSSPANARHLRVEKWHSHAIHWRARIFHPPVIGGFLLGAATYPYYGFPARYVYEGPAPIVLRTRY
jgi:hypothetical protein